MTTSIHEVTASDRAWVTSIFVQHWGAEFIVSRGKKHTAAHLHGFYAQDDSHERVGLVTYTLDDSECEMISLNSFRQYLGIGTQLVEALVHSLRASGCCRLWLITTNDNLDAIRFYQRRGFRLIAVYPNALDISRRLKSCIPQIGQLGIPLRDELEFEMML